MHQRQVVHFLLTCSLFRTLGKDVCNHIVQFLYEMIIAGRKEKVMRQITSSKQSYSFNLINQLTDLFFTSVYLNTPTPDNNEYPTGNYYMLPYSMYADLYHGLSGFVFEKVPTTPASVSYSNGEVGIIDVGHNIYWVWTMVHFIDNNQNYLFVFRFKTPEWNDLGASHLWKASILPERMQLQYTMRLGKRMVLENNIIDVNENPGYAWWVNSFIDTIEPMSMLEYHTNPPWE
jgi:hypothetical protein